MEFGKVEDKSKLELINWSLPADDPLSAYFLQKNRASSFSIRLGAPSWGQKGWVGKIYPEKTQSSQFLFHYSRYFETIELNTTHYRIPSSEQTHKWIEQVRSGFVFCPKIYKGISHSKMGLTDKALINEWLLFLKNMNDKAGPSFLQLPPYFDYSMKAILFKFLQNWSDEFPLSLEFRHPSWFASGHVLPALVEYLQTRKIGLVITDVAGRRYVLHSSISSNYVLVRFIGNELHPTDSVRIQNWSQRLESWKEMGLEKLFFFIHQPDDVLLPEAANLIESQRFFSAHKAQF